MHSSKEFGGYALDHERAEAKHSDFCDYRVLEQLLHQRRQVLCLEPLSRNEVDFTIQ